MQPLFATSIYFIPFLKASLLAVAVLLFVSCNQLAGFEKATVRNGSSLATEGCGWYLDQDGTELKAADLPESFREDGRKVLITYDILPSRSACGEEADRFQNISLEEIKDR